MKYKAGKDYSDKRLPKNIKIHHNQWEEFVAVDRELGHIPKHDGDCISGSRTFEGAVNKYLNKITDQPCYLEA
jgi:hypothetical protein